MVTPRAAHQLMMMGKMPNQMVIMGMMMKVGVLMAPTCTHLDRFCRVHESEKNGPQNATIRSILLNCRRRM